MTGERVHAVFYRAMNLGHRGSPSRTELEAALSDAGAERVRSFQTNGTVLLVADEPHAVVRSAAPGLARTCGYDGAALLRTVPSLVEALAGRYFDGHTDERTYRETFTFFDGGGAPAWPLPWTSARGDVDVVHVGDGLVLSVVRRRGATAGSPTAEVERATGGVATTRTRGSVERLVAAAAAW